MDPIRTLAGASRKALTLALAATGQAARLARGGVRFAAGIADRAVAARRPGVAEEAVGEPAAEPELRTPSGIPAADHGFNPDTGETDLVQPGTEPIMDPATTKAVKSESDTMGKAADPHKE